jgi:toxin YoeB
VEELVEHPYTGTGKPEPLKGDFSGCYSRHITQKHRIVYKVSDKVLVVLVLLIGSHYEDK